MSRPGPRTLHEKTLGAAKSRSLVQACPSCGRRQIPKRFETKLQCVHCLTTWPGAPTT
jgi:ribosomal protein L37AE/L43A